jgi:hypothetical protein
MILDYSIQEFNFTVGGVDFSPYLNSLSISPGISDITTAIVWQGDFEIVRTQNCPLTDTDFSEFLSPARWRRGVAIVRLGFYGQPGLNLRIDSYRYYRGVGRGKLTQVLDLVEFDRPSEEVGDFSFGKQAVSTAIQALLSNALRGTGVSVDLGQFSPIHTIDGELTTRTPVSDAQKLCGLYWEWLYTDTNGVVRSIERPNGGMPLFVRPEGQFEAEPDEVAIHFAAEKVIVAGSRESAKPYETTEEDEIEILRTAKEAVEKAEKRYTVVLAEAKKQKAAIVKKVAEQPLYVEEVTAKNLDEKGRARKTEIKLEKPAGALFPGSPDAGSGLVTAQKKTIYNFYEDGETSETLDFPMWLRADVRECKPVPGFGSDDGTGLYCTVIIIKEPIGVVFPQRAPGTGLITSSITIEGIQFKKVRQPLGVVIPSRGVATGLITSKLEKIESGLPLVGIGRIITEIETIDKTIENAELEIKSLKQDLEAKKIKFTSPKTGLTTRYERKVEPEPEQESPEIELFTETFKGVANIETIGYNPFVAKTQVSNVGFLPSQGVADSLAWNIAAREVARRDGLIVEMPLPIEWVQAGYPPFAIAYLDTDAVLMDAPIIDIKERRLTFSFTGERLGSVPKVLDTTPAIAPITPVIIQKLSQRSIMRQKVRFSEVGVLGVTAMRQEVRFRQASILAAATMRQEVRLIDVTILSIRMKSAVRFIEIPTPTPIPIEMRQDMRLLEVEVLGGGEMRQESRLIETAAAPIALTPIARWTLDTTAWADSIGSANLTQVGTVTIDSGRAGNAARFGGGGTNILHNNSAAFDASAPWLFSFKFRQDISFVEAFIRRRDPSNGNKEWELKISSVAITFSVNNTASGVDSVTVVSPGFDQSFNTIWKVGFIEVTTAEIRVTVNGKTQTAQLSAPPIVHSGARLELVGNACRFDDVYFYK